MDSRVENRWAGNPDKQLDREIRQALRDLETYLATVAAYDEWRSQREQS